MTVRIWSRREAEATPPRQMPARAAVISFYDPGGTPPDYAGKAERTFALPLRDLDRAVLKDFGLSEEAYLPEADALAAFIRDATADGCALICQCEYGQSRSAACAAAILQYYEGRGIDVFADDRYYPNQLVYRKIYAALCRHAPPAAEKEK